jgi:hypothetical protein
MSFLKILDTKVIFFFNSLCIYSKTRGSNYLTFLGVNIAEALVSRGIAVPIKHRHDDNNKSSKYDDLRDAESKALKAGKGIYAKALPDMMRVTDISQEIPKARAFMPFLKGKFAKKNPKFEIVFSKIIIFKFRKNYFIFNFFEI